MSLAEDPDYLFRCIIDESTINVNRIEMYPKYVRKQIMHVNHFQYHAWLYMLTNRVILANDVLFLISK